MKNKTLDSEQFRQRVLSFVELCNTGQVGEYRMYPEGHVTLYASCFAVMTLHYLGALKELSKEKRQAWAEYIKRWQNSETGRFVGPEIVPTELTSAKHDWDHVTMHLTAHVLPALHLLGTGPTYPLRFAHRFLELEILHRWLKQRDWHDAWLEGNNLLFIGQFLVYLRDVEEREEAQAALDLYFDWLNTEQDPATGLWGTNGYCDPYSAIYGGYHQLLVYYFCHQQVPYAKQIIDTTLRLQHPDGSFTFYGGGGACEDIDAVDILVNLYERTGYRPTAVLRALQQTLRRVLTQQMLDGGFVYRRDAPFTHMGITRTHTPRNISNLFATWFRVHTIALTCQVLQNHPLAKIEWQFNDICSMGWHDTTLLPQPHSDPWQDRLPEPWYHIESRLRLLSRISTRIRDHLLASQAPQKRKKLIQKLLQSILAYVKPDLLLFFIVNLARHKAEQLPSDDGLRFLFKLDARLYLLHHKLSIAYDKGIHTKHRHMRYHDFFVNRIQAGERVLDVGCGIGAVAYDIAEKGGAYVVGIDLSAANIALARKRYAHPQIKYQVGNALQELPDDPFDVVVMSNVLEHLPERPAFLRRLQTTAQPSRFLIRVPLFEREWRVPLKRELGVEWRLDDTHETEYTLESFAEEMTEAGLSIAHQEVRWGEIWAEVRADEK